MKTHECIKLKTKRKGIFETSTRILKLEISSTKVSLIKKKTKKQEPSKNSQREQKNSQILWKIYAAVILTKEA